MFFLLQNPLDFVVCLRSPFSWSSIRLATNGNSYRRSLKKTNVAVPLLPILLRNGRFVSCLFFFVVLFSACSASMSNTVSDYHWIKCAHPMGFWYITHGCQKNPAPRRSSVEISNLAETELALGCRFLILWGPPNSTRDPDMNCVEQKQSRSFIKESINMFDDLYPNMPNARDFLAHIYLPNEPVRSLSSRNFSKHCCHVSLQDLQKSDETSPGKFHLRPWGSWFFV